MKIALIGNPNCGKSTLFNAITGTYQKVGNWSGVTTEKKEGVYKKNKTITVVDLPGLYSLDAKSKDERAVLEYLNNEKPDAVINVLDGTNLERNLFLTTQILELGVPTVIAVNFADRLKRSGLVVRVEELSKLINAPVICVSALKNKGVDQVVAAAVKTGKGESNAVKTPNLAFNSAEDRYEYIESVIKSVIKRQISVENTVSDKIDKVLLGKFTGLPLFALIMVVVYFVAIGLGGKLGGYVGGFFDNLSNDVGNYFIVNDLPEWIRSLLCNAVISGVGTVASFLPQILILFTLLTILEESGYAARIAFLTDRIFRTFGLGGKSFIPLMLGCGCTVTGVMATRTESNENERILSIFLTPFMPCGAKMVVFGWFASVFFNGSAIIATSMYFLSLLCVGIFGRILSGVSAFKRAEGGFIVEIPPLRSPHLKDVCSALKEKVKDFIFKAGLIVFVVSVILWALNNLGLNGYTNGNPKQSFLYYIGNALKYLLYPLGVNSWEGAVAVLSGAFAKESVVETLELLGVDIASVFSSGFTVYAFCSFILLSPPCIAALAVAKRELKNDKLFLYMLAFQFSAGYLVGAIINLLGILSSSRLGLLLSLITVIILLISLVGAVKTLKRRKGCENCAACKVGEKACREKRYTI